MKKILLVGALALVAQFSFGQQRITGSAHDFTAYGWSQGQICLPCHTPHNAVTSTSAPLWNHVVSTTTFTTYTGPTGTMDAVTGAPTGVSLLCLSCHDGVTAVDAYGTNTPVPTLMGAIGTGSASFGSNLSNDHPISFTYNTALATADGELFDPSVALSGLGTTIAADMLFANQMECASCHDVHNRVPVGVNRMLHKSNAGSALCITCHDK